MFVSAIVRGAGAETLTLPQAVGDALQRFPELEIQRLAVEEAEGVKTDAGLLPNPAVSYSREDLSQAGASGGQWVLSASFPLGFLWTRGPEVRAADAQVQAEMRRLDHLRRQVRFEAQTAFVQYHYAREEYMAWQKISGLFQEASRAGGARQAEGDISIYEQQRIALEARRYSQREAEARIELNRRRSGLEFYTGREHGEEVTTVLDVPEVDPGIRLDVAVDRALSQRADLQAARAYMRAGDEARVAAARSGLPETNLSFGFKRQKDGFEGTVLEVEMGLPFFNRNQGGVKTAWAAFERQRLCLELLQERVRQEVEAALDRYRQYSEQVQRLEQGSVSPDSILEIGRFAYAEGELSLVEMLDGLRAYGEAFQARLDLLMSFQISRFELERAVGQPLSEFNQGSQTR